MYCLKGSREDLIKGNLEGFGAFKIGRKVIRTAKYEGHIVLLAKKEMALQGLADGLTEVVGDCGMEMSVEKSQIMKISRQPFAVQIVIDQK